MAAASRATPVYTRSQYRESRTISQYGIIVSCRKGRERYDFLLADLAAVDEDSPNAQPIQDHRVWFANR